MRLKQHVRFLADTVKLHRSQWWSRDRICAYQQDRLTALMKYAVEHVPFYAALGMRPADIRSAEDLRRFPIVTKADVQENGDRFLSQAFDKADLHCSRSSGMTGEPTTTYFDEKSWVLCKYALKARRVLSTASSPRQRILIISELRGGLSLPKALAWVLSVRNMSLTDDLETNLRALVRFAPTVIYGFPSYLLVLAQAAAEAGVSLPRVPLVYTSSEVLTAAARTSLERAFRGRVVDVYGSTEFKEIAVQCAQGRYHVNFESVHMEAVADEEDGVERLLVTTLVNTAMPLIRYELGDTGKLDYAPCACGRSGPQIVEVHGRLSEVLLFPDGTRLSPYLLMTALEQRQDIKRYRIVHERPWALRLELLALPEFWESGRSGFQENLQKILPAQASLRFVDLVDRGVRTKRRVVVREF